MKCTKRILLALPFGIAAILNALVQMSDLLHLRGEQVVKYCYLFCTPWIWLIDHHWAWKGQSLQLKFLMLYIALLWIPALLYSASLALLFWALAQRRPVKQTLPS